MKKETHPLIFPSAWFKDKPYHLSCEVSPLLLELNANGYIFTKPVKVDLEFKVMESNLLVQGSIEIEYMGECHRCLKESTVHHSEKNFTYLLDYVSFDQMINFTEPVREDILLNVPLKLLCHESCQGFCPSCRVNLNTSSCQCNSKKIDSPFMGLNIPDIPL